MNRRFFWLLTLLLGGLGGCATSHEGPARPAGNLPATSAAPAYLALGDSYTIGQGVAAADRWPTQLVALLAAQGVAGQAPTYLARTGWTTAELQAAIATANPPSSYGLVSLLIGVNNQYRGQGVGRYRPEFRALLQAAIRFAGGRAGGARGGALGSGLGPVAFCAAPKPGCSYHGCNPNCRLSISYWQ